MAIVVCPSCGVKNRVVDSSPLKQPVCGRCHTALPDAAEASDGHVLEVTDQSFEQEVLRSAQPVLLDCWAPWCPPCRTIAPTIDQLATEANGRYRVAKLNVDENPRISNSLQVSSIPTLFIFKDGQVKDRISGVQPKQTLRARLDAVA